MVPAADEGVEAMIAILAKGDQKLVTGPRVGINLLRVAEHDRTTGRTNDKGWEAESPVCVRSICEWQHRGSHNKEDTTKENNVFMIKAAREISSDVGDDKRENTKREARGASKFGNQRIEVMK